jgi:hypothetical protein
LLDCPLLRLVKVGRRQSKALGSEESSVIGSGLLEFAARIEFERFGVKTEISLNYTERLRSLYRAVNTLLTVEIIAVCSQIHTKHINTLCGQNVELVYVALAVYIVTNVAVHIVTTGLSSDVPFLLYRLLPLLILIGLSLKPSAEELLCSAKAS